MACGGFAAARVPKKDLSDRRMKKGNTKLSIKNTIKSKAIGSSPSGSRAGNVLFHQTIPVTKIERKKRTVLSDVATDLSLRVILVRDDTTGILVSIRASLTSRHDPSFSYRHYLDAELYQMLRGRYSLDIDFSDFEDHLSSILEASTRSTGNGRYEVQFVHNQGRGKLSFFEPETSKEVVGLSFLESSPQTLS